MTVPVALADVVDALAETGWAAEVLDPAWKTVWASDEMRVILRASPDAKLGLGTHFLESRRGEVPDAVIPRSGRQWVAQHAPWIMWDTGASLDELRALCRAEFCDALTGDLTPAPPPARWTFRLEYEQLGFVRGLGSRIVDDG